MTKVIGYPYGTIVQLLILTGQHCGEIAAIEWEWIDGGFLTIPASIAKNARSMTIPLGGMAQEIIEKIPRTTSTFVFFQRGNPKRHFAGFSTSKQLLDECGVKNFTHHDLRRTFATNLAKLGVRLEVTEKLLNLISGRMAGIVGIYQRHDFRKEMGEAISLYQENLAVVLSEFRISTL